MSVNISCGMKIRKIQTYCISKKLFKAKSSLLSCIITFAFYPWPVLPLGYCRCLCLSICLSVCLSISLCVNPTKTCDPFMPGSLNLDQRCKTPWLRSLLFLEMIDLDLKGQILLKNRNLPYFGLLRTISHYPFKLGSPYNIIWNCQSTNNGLVTPYGDIDRGPKWLKLWLIAW